MSGLFSTETATATLVKGIFSNRTGPKIPSSPAYAAPLDIPSRATLQRKIHTPLGMRRFLIREHGFSYVPKNRVITVPRETLFAHNPLHRYLRRSSFDDGFGSRHDERKIWHADLEKVVNPKLITDVLINDNQMTGNSITSLLAYTQHIGKKFTVVDPALSEKVNEDYLSMLRHFGVPNPSLDKKPDFLETNQRYNSLSFTEKLKIVHGFTDSVVSTLWHIASHTDKAPVPFKLHVTGRPPRRRQSI